MSSSIEPTFTEQLPLIYKNRSYTSNLDGDILCYKEISENKVRIKFSEVQTVLPRAFQKTTQGNHIRNKGIAYPALTEIKASNYECLIILNTASQMLEILCISCLRIQVGGKNTNKTFALFPH